MSLRENKLIPDEMQGIERYSCNDRHFRQPITFEDYSLIPQREALDFNNEAEYNEFVAAYPYVVFIDLSDINQYLRKHDDGGLSCIRVQDIADIVCTYFGSDSNMMDTLWSAYEDAVSEEIMAKLGIDCENTVLMVSPFDNAMNVVVEVASLVQKYLINAQFPMIEYESIYKVGHEQHGLIALQRKPYSYFLETYGSSLCV